MEFVEVFHKRLLTKIRSITEHFTAACLAQSVLNLISLTVPLSKEHFRDCFKMHVQTILKLLIDI